MAFAPPRLKAPWLVIAVGNPSRGDDALGPTLIDRLSLAETASDVEYLTDFQLQVEHALDLDGRRAVLFIDAAHPGVIEGSGIVPIEADTQVLPVSHALRPEAVLHVARQLNIDVPPAWQLAMEGQSFSLGEGLSNAAQHRLHEGLSLARDWLSARRASDAHSQVHKSCMS